MQSVFDFVRDSAVKLGQHPLTAWLRDAPDPAARRLMILPALAPLAMGLRDVSLWAMQYDRPQGELQEALTAHAFENAAQSRLFLADWRALGIDGTSGWRAGDALWWVFAAPQTAPARKTVTGLLAMAAADDGDPLLRAAWAEAVEAASDVLFAAAAAPADEYSRRSGTELLYLGRKPTAQGGGQADGRGLFTSRKLPPDQLALATTLAGRVLGLFARLFDGILHYAVSCAAAGWVPTRPAAGGERTAVLPCPGRAAASEAGSALIQSRLDQEMSRISVHPLYRWLGSPARGTGAGQLSALAPDWAVTVMSYPEVLRVLAGDPAGWGSPRAWADSLRWHGEAFLADWDALRLDDQLGLTASQAMEWLYLDPHTDVHRRGTAVWTRLAAACRTPMERSWLLETMEASGDSWFSATAGPAERAEASTGVRLDYLAGRWETPPPGGGAVLRGRVTQEEETRIADMIPLVAGTMRARLNSTWERITFPEQRRGGRPPARSQPDRQWSAAGIHEGSWRA